MVTAQLTLDNVVGFLVSFPGLFLRTTCGDLFYFFFFREDSRVWPFKTYCFLLSFIRTVHMSEITLFFFHPDQIHLTFKRDCSINRDLDLNLQKASSNCWGKWNQNSLLQVPSISLLGLGSKCGLRGPLFTLIRTTGGMFTLTYGIDLKWSKIEQHFPTTLANIPGHNCVHIG